jgi:hypothetical protein
MPTIDELAPATAAADSDEYPVSQNLITRKVTRAQVLAGVQAQLSIPAGALMGRTTAGLGSPETIAIGSYLNLATGTLSAMAAPYSVALLPGGLVPAPGDLVPLGQSGKNVAVTYSVFFQGLSALATVNGSQLEVTPTGSTTSLQLSALASSVVMKSGATLSGPLTLAADPTAALQAATKEYVDVKVNRSGDTLTGPLQLAADPVVALQAATKNYVDTSASLLHLGFTMTGPIVLAGDPTAPLNPATKEYTDTRLFRSGDTMTGPLGLSAAPVSASQAATKGYVDTQVATSLPLSGGILSGPLTLAADPTSAMQATTKEYADTKLARAGDTMSGLLTLSGTPVNTYHAAPKTYVDTQILTVLPKAGGTMTGPLILSGAPTSTSQAATKSYVDTGLAAALPVTGGTVTGPISLTVAPAVPTNVTNKQYVDTQISGVLPLSGGSLSGLLTLAAAPTVPLHAATKQYVDANPGPNGVINIKLAPCNAALNGVTDDTAAFITAYQMAPPGGTIYVPNGTTVIQAAPNWGIPTTKLVKWIIDGTTLSNGSPLGDSIPTGQNSTGVMLPATVTGLGTTGSIFSQGNSQPTDFAVLHASYVVSHTGGSVQSVISNSRTDTIISQSPFNNVWSGYDRLVWSGPQTPSATSPAKHVGRYVQAIRQTVGTNAAGTPLPQPLMWSAYVQYLDTTGNPSSWTNASVTTEMDWIGNGVDDANQRQILSLVLGQNNTAGAAAELSTAVGVSIATGSTGKVYRVFNVNVPYSISVLDTTGATQLAGAAAIRLAAGQAIAFEPTNSVNLTYSSTLSAIIAKYGATTCAIGRGISVSFGIVYSANATLSASSSGCIVFLVGAGSYTVTLPPAATVMAGTGFTFSAIGTGTVSIVAAGTDTIDLAPITLRQYDRYHIISDGSSLWREIFRTNFVSPHFAGPPVLPSYSVSGLPTAPGTGAQAFATNGRKPNEAAGAGTGVTVFYDGTKWVSVCSGLLITA